LQTSRTTIFGYYKIMQISPVFLVCLYENVIDTLCSTLRKYRWVSKDSTFRNNLQYVCPIFTSFC